MGYSVSGTTISLTRGDTFAAKIAISNQDGSEYIPADKDVIRFAMKSKYSDAKPILTKVIPNQTMTLLLAPEDTKSLEFGTYVYDIQLTKEDGTVDTFITKSSINIMEEVD